jgi:hypothetical protein
VAYSNIQTRRLLPTLRGMRCLLEADFSEALMTTYQSRRCRNVEGHDLNAVKLLLHEARVSDSLHGERARGMTQARRALNCM